MEETSQVHTCENIGLNEIHKEDNYMFIEDIEHELDLQTYNIDKQSQE